MKPDCDRPTQTHRGIQAYIHKQQKQEKCLSFSLCTGAQQSALRPVNAEPVSRRLQWKKNNKNHQYTHFATVYSDPSSHPEQQKPTPPHGCRLARSTVIAKRKKKASLGRDTSAHRTVEVSCRWKISSMKLWL